MNEWSIEYFKLIFLIGEKQVAAGTTNDSSRQFNYRYLVGDSAYVVAECEANVAVLAVVRAPRVLDDVMRHAAASVVADDLNCVVYAVDAPIAVVLNYAADVVLPRARVHHGRHGPVVRYHLEQVQFVGRETAKSNERS